MDLVDCNDISDHAILKELQSRFVKDDIYSSIGPILIAVNPFRFITGLYAEQYRELFVADALKTRDGFESPQLNSPHVWKVASATYQQLVMDRKPQAVVISGESGGLSTLPIYAIC